MTDDTNRQKDTKISQFTGTETIPDTGYLTYISNTTNYKILYSDFKSDLGVTGSLVQLGAPTGVPVLDISGSVYGIRNLSAGDGVSIEVNAQNGVTISMGSGALGAENIKEIDSAYVQDASDDVLICSGDFTIDLIDSSLAVKRIQITSLTGTVVVDPFEAQTIAGLPTANIAAGQSITITPISGGWIVG